MGLILGHSGLGYKGVSFVPDDFATSLFRCTYAISIDSSFNGKYINNQFPPSLYKAGQITLLAEGRVVYHEYINFFSRDLGLFSATPNYRQPINIYKFPYCQNDLPGPPGSKEFYEYFGVSKYGEPAYWHVWDKIVRARYPDATEEEIQTMINCAVHMLIGEINPVKLGMIRWVNSVNIELFSPGVSILVQLIDE